MTLQSIPSKFPYMGNFMFFIISAVSRVFRGNAQSQRYSKLKKDNFNGCLGSLIWIKSAKNYVEHKKG
jgi:hypothetical protein